MGGHNPCQRWGASRVPGRELLPHHRGGAPGRLPCPPCSTLPWHAWCCRPQVHLERRGCSAHVHNDGSLPPQAEGVSHLNLDSSLLSDIEFRFTCDECVAGMEWIEAYMEDPIFQVSTFAHDGSAPIHRHSPNIL